MSRINIIPMAGLGSRFAEQGYLLPKALLPVSGRPMILNVIRYMPPADKWIFIVRAEHVKDYAIDKVIKKAIPTAVVISVDKTTEGQASTCMLAMPHVKPDDSIFIAACDNAFLYNKKKYTKLVKDDSIDCIVWTFTNDDLLEANPKSWGWVRLGDNGSTITDMSVKVPVSLTPRNDHAVVATFFFRKAQDFIDAYNLMVKENYRINNEFYIDTMPIFLNKLNKKSVMFDVDLYVGWGKPDDLHVYERREYEHVSGTNKADSISKLWSNFFKLHTENPLRRQVPKFIVAGCSAVATDFILYWILIHTFLTHSPAKAISFICGTFLAYFLNKNWTFNKKGINHKEMLYFFGLYGVTLLVNVLVNSLSLRLDTGVLLAFLLATGTSTILNFSGQKWIVFK